MMRRSTGPGSSAFGGFSAIYAVALLVDSVSHWTNSGYDFFVFLFSAALLWFRPPPRAMAFLALVSCWHIAHNFLEIDSYLVVQLCFNFVILAAVIVSREEPERAVVRIMGNLRFLVVAIYAMAALHKLNFDFFRPEISCAGWVWQAIAGNYLGYAPKFPRWLSAALPYAALSMELGGALLLISPVTRGPAVLALLGMHSLLSLFIFNLFSSTMLVGLAAFFPGRALRSSDERKLSRSVSGYLAINLVACAVMVALSEMGLSRRLGLSVGGIGHSAASFALLFGLLWNRKSDGLSFGAPLRAGDLPLRAWIPVALVVLLGLSPYLGFGTAGTFSMFSNLRTEKYSNHFFIPEALKVASFQEDIVWIKRADPRVRTLYSKVGREPLEGMGLPVLEWKKLVYRCVENGLRDVSMTIVYRGQERVYDDVTRSEWLPSVRDLPLMLLSFRPIQGDGQGNRCRR